MTHAPGKRTVIGLLVILMLLVSAAPAFAKPAYVIITTEAIATANIGALNRFMADKRSQNFDVYIVIETMWGYKGISGDAAANAIRKWLIDNNGILDLIVPKKGYFDYLSVYRNCSPVGTVTENTIPTPPNALGQSVFMTSVKFRWNDGADAETPAAGLTYNLYVGTTPGGVDKVSPLADTSTGQRRIVATGNMDKLKTWTLQGMGPGQYYWSVQTIDSVWGGQPR